MPPNRDIKEPPFRIHQPLGDHRPPFQLPLNGEPGEAKHAAAIREGHPGEPLDDALQVRGELEEVAELVGDGLADLVERAAGGGGGREAEAAGNTMEGCAVGEAEEGGAELVVRRAGGGIGHEGRGEVLEKEVEGRLGHAKNFDPAGIGAMGGGGREEAEEPIRRGGRR